MLITALPVRYAMCARCVSDRKVGGCLRITGLLTSAPIHLTGRLRLQALSRASYCQIPHTYTAAFVCLTGGRPSLCGTPYTVTHGVYLAGGHMNRSRTRAAMVAGRRVLSSVAKTLHAAPQSPPCEVRRIHTGQSSAAAGHPRRERGKSATHV